MFLKTRLIFNLRSHASSYDFLKEKHSSTSNYRLYRALESLAEDSYIESFEDAVYGTCYRLLNVNSFRDYNFMLIKRFLKFWYNFVMVIGSIAAIATLILTLLKLE